MVLILGFMNLIKNKMTLQVLENKNGICKNIYCQSELIGFDKDKKFCMKCRRSEKQLQWFCESCNFNLISSNTNELNKKICYVCFESNRKNRNRRSYFKRTYRNYNKKESIPLINKSKKNIRLFINDSNLIDFSKDIISVCKYCDNYMIIKFGCKIREFCSESCKSANHSSLKRYINQSLKVIERCMREERTPKDFNIKQFENCMK